ncbi:hypothetical protein DET54_11467 [Paenibacillus pabuli]|uniref:Uncharacterized protein n=1 Tax=Paenibacillus pabuli TaxID=1472 RepID=A0ABX9BEU0_9BACL|nr:hypothetical protein [Paenibacillus pabuli]RAI89599.1 hypothetical protein DET54_11467 [Paenibacillus pabuli]
MSDVTVRHWRRVNYFIMCVLLSIGIGLAILSLKEFYMEAPDEFWSRVTVLYSSIACVAFGIYAILLFALQIEPIPLIRKIFLTLRFTFLAPFVLISILCLYEFLWLTVILLFVLISMLVQVYESRHYGIWKDLFFSIKYGLKVACFSFSRLRSFRRVEKIEDEE